MQVNHMKNQLRIMRYLLKRNLIDLAMLERKLEHLRQNLEAPEQ